MIDGSVSLSLSFNEEVLFFFLPLFSFSAEVTVYPGFNGSRFNQRRRGRKKFKGLESTLLSPFEENNCTLMIYDRV